MFEACIYLDNNSTTQMDKRVLKAMLPYLQDAYANSSSSHSFGKNIRDRIQVARQQVASLINANESEIIFTSGATESVNLALKGISYAAGSRVHIITIKTEHKSVLDTCKYLETIGIRVTYLPVQGDGTIDLLQLERSITVDTVAICAMLVNNETGVLANIVAIGKIAKEKNVYLICDATQAVGKIPVNVQAAGIDLLALSAHKFYGPKGVGALYINKSTINEADFVTVQHGGGHENGFRSGTLNSAGIIGLGEACSLASEELAVNEFKIGRLKKYAELLLQKIPGYTIHGNPKKTLFNTLNFHLPNFDANVFIALNQNLAVSNGSACTASTLEASYVLDAMGINSADSYCSLRVSIGKWNSKGDIDALLEMINSYPR